MYLTPSIKGLPVEFCKGEWGSEKLRCPYETIRKSDDMSICFETQYRHYTDGQTQGRRSWSFGGPDPMKICRRSESMF